MDAMLYILMAVNAFILVNVSILLMKARKLNEKGKALIFQMEADLGSLKAMKARAENLLSKACTK